MKKFLQLILLFIFTIPNSKAQTWPWAVSGDGIGGARGYAICSDSNGNVYMAGWSNGTLITFGSYTASNSGCGPVLAKFDANGNALWVRSALGTGKCETIAVDHLGNVYVAGNYDGSPTLIFGTFTLTPPGGMFLTKYDSNGNILWVKSSTGGGGANSIAINSNGDILVTGNFWAPTAIFDNFTVTNTANTGFPDIFVAKYNSNGTAIWVKSTGSSSLDWSSSIIVDSEDNFCITGYFWDGPIIFDSYTLTTPLTSAFIVKYDNNGNVLWAKNTDGMTDVRSNSITRDSNNNYYITGYYSGASVSFSTETLPSAFNQKMFLAKYDVNGNLKWAKSSNDAGTYHAGYSIASNSSNIFISGSFTTAIGFGNYTTNAPPDSFDPMFVAKYDFNGNFISLDALALGGQVRNAICTDNYCNAYITGGFGESGPMTTFSVGSNILTQTSEQNIFVAKLNSNCETVGFELKSKSISEISICPNPNNGTFKIHFGNDIKNGQLILINSIGQKVYEQKITQGTNEIKTNGLPFGLYNYILLQENQTVKNGKLTIE